MEDDYLHIVCARKCFSAYNSLCLYAEKLNLEGLQGTYVHDFRRLRPLVVACAMEKLSVLRKAKEQAYDMETRTCELAVPEVIWGCNGVNLGGVAVKSFVFSTDIAVILNCDAQAVLCVYPFACRQDINKSIIQSASRPVLNGVAGAITSGEKSLALARAAQDDGAAGVVANMMTDARHIAALREALDIPVILTVACLNEETEARIEAGASMVNVAAGHRTAQVVAQMRKCYPQLPLIASGGASREALERTIDAGADAIVWTPPNIQEIERQVMLGHRIRANA